jgi:hypothetical protein
MSIEWWNRIDRLTCALFQHDTPERRYRDFEAQEFSLCTRCGAVEQRAGELVVSG